MKLKRFRVTNFRSVADSGWLDVDDVTALIGTNESGKTNLLVPLWKLKPAKDGAINPIADYPRKRYNEIRAMAKKPVFIEARFELSDDLAADLAALTGTTEDDIRVVDVTRDLGGNYTVGFPDASPQRDLPSQMILDLLSAAIEDIRQLDSVVRAEDGLKAQILDVIEASLDTVRVSTGNLDKRDLAEIRVSLAGIDTSLASKRSAIAPRYAQLLKSIEDVIADVSKPHPNTNSEAKKAVLNNLPSFVYYSNYGNLDSEIYLPHVIQNLRRTDLGSHEEAKARTLRVLFEFVRLDPQEILELGREFDVSQRQPTHADIRTIAEKKKEREILLQSASVDLTQKFRSWWKQGDYKFRFQADGDHFRIWVSDDRRPEEVELEGRSTGLQWFLSFYLVFLVESTEAHKNAILLLDEAGLSLHPVAQKDLIKFFDGLAETNQIIYTTHSPFLVDPDHLDRVKAVYVNDRGTTEASANLRASEANPAQSKSIFAVHAALGLSVSETILQGCQPVIVEGPSDQLFLSAIKNYLISKGYITPRRELVFVPAGGVRGVSAAASVLTGKEEALPYVVLDSDASGETQARQLKSNLYRGADDRIILVGAFCAFAGAEIEDLFPMKLLADIIDRSIRARDEDFPDVVIDGQPIVPQVERYAQKHALDLAPGWKVEIAAQAKTRLLRANDAMSKYPETVEKWKALFAKFEG